MKPLIIIFAAGSLLAQERVDGLSFTGSMDAGYRWLGDVGGNNDSYRSIVDLGSGPRLLDFDFRVEDSKRRFFDEANLRGSGWGGDPYSTAYFAIGKPGLYRLHAGHRNLAYFNFLPSFANPQLERGGLLNQHAFDTHRRMSEVTLDLFPSSRLKPYLSYSRDSGTGTGITTFVAEGNEYAVATLPRDKTDRYRGGLRFDTAKVQATIEQGATQFKDDQRVFTADPNRGNRSTSYLGQRLELRNLEQSWTARGTSSFSRAAVSASLTSWFDVNAQFLYSRPETEATYFHAATGRFANLNSLIFSESIQQTLISGAQQPHSSGSAGFELRPWRGLRMVESFTTDRLRNEGSGLPEVNQSQQQMTILYDFSRKLSAWAGHRYTWGDALFRDAFLADGGGTRRSLQRHTKLAGARFRATDKLSFHSDLESATSGSTYFRTSLHNYDRLRARSRFQMTDSLSVSADAAAWRNENPLPAAGYKSSFWDAGASMLWTPAKRRMTVMGAYSRSAARSDISYLVPETRTLDRSLYRDIVHSGSATIECPLPKGGGIRAGGTWFTSTGSRPTHFYQPDAQIAIPIHKRVQWLAQWRWYGFSERLQAFESFRSHQFIAGIRLGAAQ